MPAGMSLKGLLDAAERRGPSILGRDIQLAEAAALKLEARTKR
jgi:hypothetical protein